MVGRYGAGPAPREEAVKIKFDIEATPQELRTFFGLPDVEPLQREMLDMIREQMQKGAAGFDPATLLKPFMPPHLQSVEAMHKAFWDALAGQSPATKKTP